MAEKKKEENKGLFAVFGRMESAEAINEAARGLVAEGDLDNLKVLAKENGLDEDMAEFMAAGEINFLCDDMTAALGRIDVELADYHDATYKGLACEIYETMKGYLGKDYIKLTITDSDYATKIDVSSESLAKAVMKAKCSVSSVTKKIVETVKKKQSRGGWVPSATLCALAMNMYLGGGKA